MGSDGGEKGFGGITKSIAIEFDTYENYSQFGDPNGNHISIQSRGSISNSANHRFSLACCTNLPSKLNDGNIHSVKIIFDQKQNCCFVEMDGNLVLNAPVHVSDLLFNGQDKEIFIGFTAGTGGITQTHVINSWCVLEPK